MTEYRNRRERGEYDTAATTPTADQLDGMTKAELIDYADTIGADVDASETKAEIRAAIDAERGGV
jgi:hypothetical protein